MINWRLLLLPFGWIYGCITGIRNVLFDLGVLSSYTIPSKSIVVGNLSVGGTGKSPHILYLVELLNHQHEIAIVSRGYGRTTKGLLTVEENSEAINVGDEPLMFKKRLRDRARVLVSEKREIGVKSALESSQNCVVLLDDAFQHRKVKAGFNVLLTDYSQPYYSDFMLPAGNLREWRAGAKRADCIVVTKCPEDLSLEEMNLVSKKVNRRGTPLFFSHMEYGDLVSFGKKQETIEKVLLVTGIANPKPLETWLNRFYQLETVRFPDHHNFSHHDLEEIHQKIDSFANENAVIVTTEKDYVRLNSLLTENDKLHYPWYYQSMTVKINEEEQFKAIINAYVDTI